MSDFGEHLHNASLKNEGSKELKDDGMEKYGAPNVEKRNTGPNSPAHVDINFNNILGDLVRGPGKMGAALPLLWRTVQRRTAIVTSLGISLSMVPRNNACPFEGGNG